VTTLAGKMVRPHDLELFDVAEAGTMPAMVERITRIGFEVRVDLQAGGESTWVQTTRGQADGLDLVPGRELWLRASPRASTITVSR
jgi:sulfate transport system ATP-binding protein